MKFLYFVSICALLQVGCERPTHEEKKQVLDEKWGPELTLKDEHLLVNWGDIEGVASSKARLSLRIPRGYLNGRFGEQDEKGKVERLYLEMMLPDGQPLPPVEISNISTDVERDRLKERMSKRVFVVLYRDHYMQTVEDIHRRKFQVSGAGRNIFLDGEVGGLEKYSAMICLADHKTSPPNHMAMVQRNLDSKMADDPSPPGCYRNVRKFILVSPLSETDRQVVFARCSNETCRVQFNIANRTAELTSGISNIDRLMEKVSVSRRVVEAFVLHGNP